MCLMSIYQTEGPFSLIDPMNTFMLFHCQTKGPFSQTDTTKPMHALFFVDGIYQTKVPFSQIEPMKHTFLDNIFKVCRFF